MLIFGLSSKDTLLATLPYVCEYCGVHAGHHLIKHARRFSVFFIPVLPLGTKYLDTCINCGRTLEVSAADAERAAAAAGPGLR